jgi:hypothetical protein
MTIQMSDGELRRAYDALLRAHRDDATSQRVSPERLLALVERRGTEAERLATLNVVMSDPDSAREFELLRSLAIAQRASARRGLESPRVWIAIAAMLLVVAIPAGRLVMRPSAGEPMRSTLQGAVLVTPPENASAFDSRTFAWHPVAGAQAYRLELLTAAGSPVFTTRTVDTTVTLPRDVTIAANVEHRWWVSTEMTDGTQRSSVFRRLLVRDTR